MPSANVTEAAARMLMNAQHARKDLVEKPIRAALENADYGFRELVVECESWGMEVSLADEAGVYTIRVMNGDRTIFTLDHLARCLRAEMAAAGTFPGGVTYQHLEAAVTGTPQRTYRSKKCGTCGGAGRLTATDPCPACGGYGTAISTLGIAHKATNLEGDQDA